MQVLEHLHVDGSTGDQVFTCTRCSTPLGPVTDNYKRFALVRERSVSQLGELYGDPARFVDDEIVFREFLCPHCGGLIDTEVNRRDEPPVHDIQVGATRS